MILKVHSMIPGWAFPGRHHPSVSSTLAAVFVAESPEGSGAAAGGLQTWDSAPRSHQQGGQRQKLLNFYSFLQFGGERRAGGSGGLC